MHTVCSDLHGQDRRKFVCPVAEPGMTVPPCAPAAPGEHVECAGKQTLPKGLAAALALLLLEKQSQISHSHRERPDSLEGAFHNPEALRGGMSICKDSMDCSGSSWYRCYVAGSIEQMDAVAIGWLPAGLDNMVQSFSNLAMNGNDSLITTGFFFFF